MSNYSDNPLVMQWQSPLGMLQAVCDPNGATLLKLHWVSHRVPGMAESETAWHRGDAMPLLQAVQQQVAAYCEGKRRDFDLPIQPMGTEFQWRVWQVVQRIPYGETWSYRRVAQAMGHPKSVRAVAAACGRNPWILIVPCHRVIGSDGTLTGYSAGLPRKQALLAWEAAVVAGHPARSQSTSAQSGSGQT